ncbi:MAG: SGNH/GDSL hydrolase family protein [Desulfomonilaceae bacterium]|nr:SGNH/GDSL hydrolase family protein [Desulfomonilaceae bacterium]
MSIVKTILFRLFLALIAVCLLEAVLQVTCLVSPKAKALLSSRSGLTVPDDKLGWRGNPEFADHDAKGFRNRSSDGTADVTALGDSMTYGVWVDRDEPWPAVLGRAGNLRVYNMGISGYGPIQYMLMLEEALEHNPKLVILTLYMGNDLFDSYSMVYEWNLVPALKTSDPKKLAEFRDLDRSSPVDEASIEVFEPHRKIKEFLAEHSKTYALLWLTKHMLVPDHTWPWFWLKYRAASFAPWEAFEQGPVRTILTPTYRFMGIDQNDARNREGLRLSLEAIDRINRSLKEKGVGFLVLLLPTKELAVEDLMKQGNIQPSPEYARLVKDEKKIWETVRANLQERSIPFVDASTILRKSLNEGKSPYLINHDPHPNAYGHEIIGRYVGSEIGRMKLPHSHMMGRTQILVRGLP